MAHAPVAPVAVLADRQVFLVHADGTEEEVTSPFVEDVRRREASIERKSSWKTSGTGARFMGAAALWDEGQGRRSPAWFSCLSRGRRPGEILYAISTGPVSGLFAYDVSTKEEVRLAHDTSGAPFAIATSDDHHVVALARDQKNGSRNLAVMRDDGGDVTLVTDGDTVDDAPSWVPVSKGEPEGRHQLLFQSTPIGRDPAGMIAGFGPTEVNLLDAEHGSLKTILSSPTHDYLAPRMMGDGALYVMRRPYSQGPRDVDPATRLKDGLFAPFRLAYAGFRYLDFLTMKYTGKPLATSGNTRGRGVDARKLLEGQNVAAAGDEASEETYRAPKDWELVRRLPSGDETVVARQVAAYTLARDGGLLVSDGNGILRVGDAGRATRISKRLRALGVVAV